MDEICLSFLRTHTHTHTLVCFFLAVHTFVWANMHLGREFSLVLVLFWMKSKRTTNTYWHFYSSAHTPQSTMGRATTPQTVPVYKINYCMWCTCWKVFAQPLSVFLLVRKWYLQDTRCDTDELEVPAFSVSGHLQSQTISHWGPVSSAQQTALAQSKTQVCYIANFSLSVFLPFMQNKLLYGHGCM